MSQPRLLLLSPADNVLVATSSTDAIPIGFKVARHAIAAGEKVIKWGAPIGSATRDIAAGEVVHVNNMRSDYMPTFAESHRYA
jgi:hypothetical protein